MKKQTFLTNLEQTWACFRGSYTGLTEAQLTEPGVTGEWSVKDVIAHVSWYERQMVGMITTRSLAGSPWWNLTLEVRNAAIQAENRDRPLDEILKESQEVFGELMKQLESLSEEDLHTAINFKDMPTEWVPWEVIASNTFEHYPDHSRDIQNNLNQSYKDSWKPIPLTS